MFASTKLAICHNVRISRNRVFRSLAKRGRNTMGWFFGFERHLLTNHVLSRLAAYTLAQSKVNIANSGPIPNISSHP